MKKKCNICGATDKVAEFYGGVTSRCKECHKKKVRENRAAKVDYYRQYDAHRFQNDPRVKARNRAYAQTEAGKAAAQKSRKKWLEQNAGKRAAHIILGNAVRDRRVIKPDKCSVCGAAGRIEGHHDDYAKPLDVLWLCRKCHIEHHRQENI